MKGLNCGSKSRGSTQHHEWVFGVHLKNKILFKPNNINIWVESSPGKRHSNVTLIKFTAEVTTRTELYAKWNEGRPFNMPIKAMRIGGEKYTFHWRRNLWIHNRKKTSCDCLKSMIPLGDSQVLCTVLTQVRNRWMQGLRHLASHHQAGIVKFDSFICYLWNLQSQMFRPLSTKMTWLLESFGMVGWQCLVSSAQSQQKHCWANRYCQNCSKAPQTAIKNRFRCNY